jgi:tRNA pseudouridine55 synthase
MDIGRALGCGASLTALRRTAVGPFRIEDATALDRLERDGEAARRALLPPEALVAALPRIEASEVEAERFGHGQPIAREAFAAGAELALFGPGGRFLGVGVGEPGGIIAPLRLVAREAPGYA